MDPKLRTYRIMFITGIVAMLVGVIDPLEGSVLITAGNLLITVSAFLMHDRHRKIFLTASVLVVVGVFFLFFFSSLGGIGEKTAYSMWWGILMLPYPAGFLLTVTMLLIRAFKKKQISQNPDEQQD